MNASRSKNEREYSHEMADYSASEIIFSLLVFVQVVRAICH